MERSRLAGRPVGKRPVVVCLSFCSKHAPGGFTLAVAVVEVLRASASDRADRTAPHRTIDRLGLRLVITHNCNFKLFV